MRNVSGKRMQSGFTLIEISIVLVIIGLIVGGLFVGSDLIRAAEIRATVGQVEEFGGAVNAFGLKYAALPGDMPSARAARLGFFAETTFGGTVGHQDGNGYLNGAGESLGFWRHLTDAQFIDGNYGTAASGNALDPATGVNTTAATAGAVSQLIAPADIGRGNLILAFYAVGGGIPANWLQVAGVSSISGAGVWSATFNLTPLEAQAIDAKLDNGLMTGRVVGGGPTCSANGIAYDVGAANGNLPLCSVSIRLR